MPYSNGKSRLLFIFLSKVLHPNLSSYKAVRFLLPETDSKKMGCGYSQKHFPQGSQEHMVIAMQKVVSTQ